MAPAVPIKLTTQLEGGEQDVQNVNFIKTLTNAWTRVSNHPKFVGHWVRVAHKPPTSTQTICLRWVTSKNLSQAANGISPPNRRYTCAINLAWVDFQWSATPGVPVRMEALLHLRDTLFKTPCPLPMVRVAVPREPEYQPHMHKGQLKQVSPEKITAAYILAIARDVENQEEDYIMSEWVKYLRTCTCVFIVLDADMEMYWHAAKQREALEQTYRLPAVHAISGCMRSFD